jgi:hypothetical protein
MNSSPSLPVTLNPVLAVNSPTGDPMKDLQLLIRFLMQYQTNPSYDLLDQIIDEANYVQMDMVGEDWPQNIYSAWMNATIPLAVLDPGDHPTPAEVQGWLNTLQSLPIPPASK